jgi:hypothetical protein
MCRFTVTLFRLYLPFATAAQLRNCRKQDEVSARLARAKPDNRATQRAECETFRLAIEIAEPARFEERSSPPTRRELTEPRNRGRLVTEKIKASVWTDLEVTEVSAGLGKCLVWKPDCEGNESVAAFVNRPLLAVRQCAAADQAPRLRIRRAELNQRRRLFLFGDKQMPAGQ